MSNETPEPLPPCVEDIFARFRAHDALAAELHPANKASVFAVLRDADIVKVVVQFDGYGDSGQIEEITVTDADGAERTLPDVAVTLRQVDFGEEQPRILSQPLQEAIETMTYGLLSSSHCGWENNEGAFGDFVFDVTAGTILLDYNERFESSENHQHQF